MQGAALPLLVFSLALASCAAPAVAPRTPTEKLPDDGPRNCIAAATTRAHGAMADNVRPAHTAGTVFGPTRTCVTNEEAIDYASLPILQATTELPYDDGLETVVAGHHAGYRANELARASPADGPRAEWLAFRHAGLKPLTLDLFYSSGHRQGRDYDLVAGNAAALIEGTLYAFRECFSGCDAPLGSRRRTERLVIVGPEAEWISTSTDDLDLEPLVETATGFGAFSFASAVVEQGGSATVGLTIAPESLVRFGAIPASKLPEMQATPDDVARFDTFTLELVWPNESAPELTLYRGVMVAPAATSTVSQSGRRPRR